MEEEVCPCGRPAVWVVCLRRTDRTESLPRCGPCAASAVEAAPSTWVSPIELHELAPPCPDVSGCTPGDPATVIASDDIRRSTVEADVRDGLILADLRGLRYERLTGLGTLQLTYAGSKSLREALELAEQKLLSQPALT